METGVNLAPNNNYIKSTHKYTERTASCTERYIRQFRATSFCLETVDQATLIVAYSRNKPDNKIQISHKQINLVSKYRLKLSQTLPSSLQAMKRGKINTSAEKLRTEQPLDMQLKSEAPLFFLA
jgi:hypothetical protein